ncbi:hypothetical protein Tco_1474801 [Tanacetum coccineum]
MIVKIWVNIMQRPILVFWLVTRPQRKLSESIIGELRKYGNYSCTFDELTLMASEQFNSGPGLQFMTPATSNSGLVPNPIHQQSCIPPTRNDWDRLFQPMFDEYFNPPPSAISIVQEASTPRAVCWNFPKFYKKLEVEVLGAGEKLIGLQLLQLELRLGKTPSRSFRPVKSAESLCQFWASCSLRVSLTHDGSWSKWEPSLWLCG